MLKINIDAADLSDDQLRAFVKIQELLNMLPTKRERRRVLLMVYDRVVEQSRDN